MPTMMRDAAISFPLLGSWSIDPSASFTLFGRTFYWYGVIIAVGFILAMLYCARHCRRCGIEPDTLKAMRYEKFRNMGVFEEKRR